jgi:hypothetical protein
MLRSAGRDAVQFGSSWCRAETDATSLLKRVSASERRDFSAMTLYYEHMGWGTYTTDQE